MDRLKLLKTFYAEDPNDPFNIYALAIEYRNNNTEKSLFFFNELYQKFPNYLPQYFPYCELLIEQELLDDVKKLFEQGIEVAQNSKDVKAEKELKNAYQNFLFEFE